MFASRRNPLQAYADIGIETGVSTADPHKLIVMLFDGALLAISNAARHMQQKEIPEKGKAISMAINIISFGLKASLDKKSGGDLAEKLDALYDYMCTRLVLANAHNDKSGLEEVKRLLGEIKSAWEEIANDPAVRPQSRSAA